MQARMSCSHALFMKTTEPSNTVSVHIIYFFINFSFILEDFLAEAITQAACKIDATHLSM